MTLAAGSPAKVRCPECRSAEAKVGLNAANVVYFLGSACRHAWAEPKSKTPSRKAS